MLISTSILSLKDKSRFKEIDNTSTDFIHIDVMDNEFVPNYNDYDNLNFNKKIDVHLMVNDVLNYIKKYEKYSPEYITFHIEIEQDIDYLIDYLKNKGIKVGISIKPNTNLKKIIPYLDKIDLVLVMSVEPGFGGQSFIETTPNRINELIKIRKNNNYKYLIEVDGGINNKTIKLVNNVDIAVVGSYITNSDNFEEKINDLK